MMELPKGKRGAHTREPMPKKKIHANKVPPLGRAKLFDSDPESSTSI